MWRRNKFKAQRTANGFPSKLEEAVHNLLLLREKSGEISNIRRQQQIVLQDGAADVRITWRIDWICTNNETGSDFAVEAKGLPTPEYKLKLKLFKAKPPMDLEIWSGSWQRPKLMEIVKK